MPIRARILAPLPLLLPTLDPTSAPSPDAPAVTTADAPLRVVLGGFLMGLANLVPGVSGGTMILAVGLYDRFIGAVAELSSLRWSRGMFVFLALVALGLGVALVGLAGPAVYLVGHHRWAMYALFVGMTLGGVPELRRLAFPAGEPRGGGAVAALLGFGAMAYLAWALAGTSLPQSTAVFLAMGAVAASSMILPGVSGSYILLIFGLYDAVVGSLSSSALREDLGASLAVIVPVGVGAAVGIAVLSNVLKVVLTRWSRPAHGALLGLLVGSVLGLWPFQEARYEVLVPRDDRKAVVAELEALEVADVSAARPAVRELFLAREATLEEADLELLAAAVVTDTERGAVKRLASITDRYAPGAGDGAAVVGLFLLGFLLVRRLSPHHGEAPTA